VGSDFGMALPTLKLSLSYNFHEVDPEFKHPSYKDMPAILLKRKSLKAIALFDSFANAGFQK